MVNCYEFTLFHIPFSANAECTLVNRELVYSVHSEHHILCCSHVTRMHTEGCSSYLERHIFKIVFGICTALDGRLVQVCYIKGQQRRG